MAKGTMGTVRSNAARSAPALLLALLACTVHASVAAQFARVTVRNENLWVSHWGDHRLHARWSVHTELHWRRAELGQDWQQLLLRPAANFHLNPQVMFTLGYSYYRNHPYGTFPANFQNWEHNIYEQVQLNQALGRMAIAHRFRMEERFIARMRGVAGNESVAELDGYTYQNRFRYRVWVTVPLGKRSSTIPGTWSAHVYDEVFLNFGDTYRPDHIQQNRLSVLLGFQVSRPVQLLVGYLHQHLQRPGAAAGADLVESNSTLHLVMVCNLDLRNKNTSPANTGQE